MFKKYLRLLTEDTAYMEEYFPSEFTTGFELEAWADEESYKDDFENWAEDYWENEAQNDERKDSKIINLDTMNMGNDPTIHSDEYEEYETCYSCDGDGTQTCDECGGDGEINQVCRNCGGLGEIEENCPECNGEGVISAGDNEIDCPECNGEGKVLTTCPECDGEGEVSIICPECDGEGSIYCRDCDGNGSFENEEYDPRGYEWNSPVFKVTPKNLQRIIKFLNEGIRQGYINTNSSCALHTHIGLPDRKNIAEDMFWILCQIATNDEIEWFEKILKFKGFNFTEATYARPQILKNIQKGLQYIENNAKEHKDVLGFFKDNVVENNYTENKYQAIRQHPQGTLEWRGVRGFLDNQRIEDIRDFYITSLYPVVKRFSKYLDRTKLKMGEHSISRQEFNNILKQFDTTVQKKKRNTDRRFSPRMDFTKLPEIFDRWPWLNNVELDNVILTINNDDELVMISGSFKNGIWKEGHIKSGCYFLNGTFESGTFSGIFKGGTFKGGTFKESYFASGYFENGIFVNSQWYLPLRRNSIVDDDAHWINGTWISGDIYDQVNGRIEYDYKQNPNVFYKELFKKEAAKEFNFEGDPMDLPDPTPNNQFNYNDYLDMIEKHIKEEI